MKELKDDGAGVFGVISSWDVDICVIEDKVEKGTPWDMVTKAMMNSILGRAR